MFLPNLRESVISPLLKTSTLDKDELSNCRPISSLSLISHIALLNRGSLITSLSTDYLILINLPTVYVIPLKWFFYVTDTDPSVQ